MNSTSRAATGVTGQINKIKRTVARHTIGAFIALVTIFSGISVAPLTAASGERTLYLYYTHVQETKRITFRRNGRYDQNGLNELNAFLRDWRRDEPTRMDPALFDLIWQVYQDVGATSPIYVVSAYRSPQTNEMLRSRSSAVAKNSRHTMGMAMDFYIPGIPISRLREAAMRHQVGGVGYYPTSGSPFVHLDTGNVRAWPRMTRAQLTRLFPNGRTLHLPSDGVPLSQEGRRYASAEYAKCGSIPCVGANPNTFPSNGTNKGGGSGRTLLDLFFGRGEDPAPVTQVADTGPTQRRVTSVQITPPTPAPRAGFLDLRGAGDLPPPTPMPRTVLVAVRQSILAQPDLTSQGVDPINVASISDQPRPTPRLLLSGNLEQLDSLTAYAPVLEPEPDAQRALQMLIERRNSAGALVADNPVPDALHPTPAPVLRGSIITASLSPQAPLETNPIASLFQGTWDAVFSAKPELSAALSQQLVEPAAPPSSHLTPLPIIARPTNLVAPDLGHVAQSMVMPVVMSEAPFAIMFEPDRGDFSPQTELGAHSGQIYFSVETPGNLASNRFTSQSPFIVVLN